MTPAPVQDLPLQRQRHGLLPALNGKFYRDLLGVPWCDVLLVFRLTERIKGLILGVVGCFSGDVWAILKGFLFSKPYYDRPGWCQVINFLKTKPSWKDVNPSRRFCWKGFRPTERISWENVHSNMCLKRVDWCFFSWRFFVFSRYKQRQALLLQNCGSFDPRSW